MKLKIEHQDSYSRGELILRTLFGWLYIAIPHFFLMFFVGIWGMIVAFLSFWVILFTGKFPKGFFEFLVKFMNWGIRVYATMHNLVDGYPQFGVNGSSDKVSFDVEYPESVSRGLLLLRLIFGWLYVLIPHGFCLFFRGIAFGFIQFIAWWVVLFTGKYPESWHSFMVGTYRWVYRVNLYLGYFTDEYPPFSGKE